MTLLKWRRATAGDPTPLRPSAAVTDSAAVDATDLTDLTDRRVPYPLPPILAIHGSWHGGWAWDRVAGVMAARGQAFYAPTLAGHVAGGVRGGITMEHYVDSVVACIHDHHFQRVHLVGWSFGGAVILATLQRLSETGELGKVAGVTFLSAFIPTDGTSCVDAMTESGTEQAMGMAAGMAAMISPTDHTCPIFDFPLFRQLMLPETTSEDGAVGDEWVETHVYRQLGAEPWLPFEQPVRCKDALAALHAGTPPSTFLLPPLDQGPEPGFWERMAQRVGPTCQLIHLPAGGHECLFTYPSMLAQAILDAVAAPYAEAIWQAQV